MLPTSPSSTSSYDLLSSLSCSSGRAGETSSDSDDEIVWPQSLVSTPESSSESSLLSDDDDDFVVLSRPRLQSYFHSPITRTADSTEDELSCVLSDLSLRQTPGASVACSSLKPTVTNALVLKPPIAPGGSSKSQKKKKRAQKKAQKSEPPRKAKKVARPGTTVEREVPVVDDASSVTSAISTVSGYEEAAKFITSFVFPLITHLDYGTE